MLALHENPKYIQSLFFVQIKNITKKKKKLSTRDFYQTKEVNSMAAEAQRQGGYNQELVQVMKEHELIEPEEEEQITTYLFLTQ